MHGGACCLLGVCCPFKAAAVAGEASVSEVQPKRLHTLVREIKKHTSATDVVAHEVAKLVLTQFDLVPKGIGDAIVEAYRPFFKIATEGGGD